MSRSLVTPVLALAFTCSVVACGGGGANNNSNNNATPLSIDGFSVSSDSVASGGSVTLNWRVSGATAVSVSITRSPGTPPLEGSTDLEGSVDSGPITANTIFTLTVTGNGQTVSSAPLTVVVDASALEILSFTASPNPAPVDGTVTLAWATAGATRVTILEGTTPLHMDTAAQGTFAVDLSDTAHTYTLRAENNVMSTSAMLTVTTETPPEITAFTVSPNTFTGASTDVTITFAATGQTFELTANDMPVPGFDGQSSGTLNVTVSESTRFDFSVNGAGQTVTVSAVVAKAIAEVEPNDDIGTATPIETGATGSITMDDVDFYSFTVPAGGNVYAEISDGMGGCPFDSLIALYNGTDPEPLTSAFNLFGGCLPLDPAFDAGAVDLPAGTYYIAVESASDLGDYSLVLVVGGASCGNRLLELSTGEQCDDGNTTAGDGCSATCEIEPGGTVSGLDQDITFSQSIIPATSSDFFQVVLPSEGYIIAQTGVPTIGDCAEPADTILRLLDADYEEVAVNDDAPGSLCSRLDNFDTGENPLAAGTYWIQVSSYGGSIEIGTYQVQIQTVGLGCGNSVVETSEQCDDGNVVDGDGCSSTCTIETAGSVSGAGGTLSLNLNPADGFPTFIDVTVTAGQSITATTTGANMGPCPFGTVIGLFDDAFTVQYGANSGNGGCASIDPSVDGWAANLPAGLYKLGVATAEGAGGAVDVTVVLNDAACGNGIVETQAGEQCDDGNTTASDGCDASCQFEGGVAVEVEPNDTIMSAQPLTISPGGSVQTISGGIATVGDIDTFSFTIASGTASLDAITYPTFLDPTSCNFEVDTLVELLDSAGTVIATNDDDANRMGFCSRLNSTSDMNAGGLAAGTYYVVVRHFNNMQSFPQYFLDVALTTP